MTTDSRYSWTSFYVGGLRGLFPLRGRPDRGRQVVADVAHHHAPRADQADDHRIQAARAGAVPLRYSSRRRASPPVTVGATGPGGPHLRGRRSWSHSRFLVLGCAERADPAPPRIPDDRSAQRPARVPGPLFEQSGEQAIGPSDHRPRSNRSARTSRPTPQRNTTAPLQPRPPTRAITSSVITYRSFQIEGTYRQMNTPTGRSPR